MEKSKKYFFIEANVDSAYFVNFQVSYRVVNVIK